MIVYGQEPFLNDGFVDKLTVSSKFRCLVVWTFRRFAMKTEEKVNFNFFEFETRLAMIVTIAMATRLTQPECAIRTDTSVKYLNDESGGGDQGMPKSLLLDEFNPRFVSVIRKIWAYFFRNSDATKSHDGI